MSPSRRRSVPHALTAACIAAVAGLPLHASEPQAKFVDPAPAPATAVNTFTQHDDGAAGKVLPDAPAPKARVSAKWDTPPVQIAPARLAADLPDFFILNGKAVNLPIDTSRIAVKVKVADPAHADEALTRIARTLGVPVATVNGPAVANWRFINFPAPLGNAGAINAVLELLLTDPSIEYAAPIHNNPDVAGGYLVVPPEINIRVREAHAGNALAVIAQASKNIPIASDDLGGLRGAAQLRSNLRNGFAVLKQANTLAADARVAWAEPDFLGSMKLDYIPNDPSWSSWGWEQANDIDTDADLAWDLTRGNPAMKVLVLDCGVEQNHPDINQLAGRDFTTGAVGGIAGGGPAGNCDNHGTAVAGIITGRINNGIGGAGVAPNCRVISAKTAVEDTNPCASTYAAFSGSWLANAINWGVGQGCLITNSSFGVGQSATIDNAYDNAEANGLLHFASAGNGGSDQIGDPTLGYPARLASVEAVAAIGTGGTLTSFSNWGTGLQYAAPGTGVASCDRQDALGYTGTDYCSFGGTSAASPFAAGVAALFWSAFPQYANSSVRVILRATSRDLGPVGYESQYGWGFPNANTALRFPGPNNTWCDEATVITGNDYDPAPYSVVNANAAIDELDESCEFNAVGVSHTVWYTFVPPCTGAISLNTNGSDYDTVLSVFRGNCLSATQVGCDDDSGTGTQSQITSLPVTAGFSYFIKVSAYGPTNAGGTLDFNFTYAANPPANDDCADAYEIIGNSYSSSRCTVGATGQLCESSENCELNAVGTSKSVWWQYTPTQNGSIDIDTNGSNYDTVLSVFTGCGGAILINGNIVCIGSTQIACDDDSGTGTQSLISALPVRAGTTYRFKAAGYGASSTGGDLDFHFAYHPCPADFNLSGSVTVQDIFDFLTAYFANSAQADFNGVGGVTVQDIFDFLSAYFSGICG